jgi:NADP-dependent 3-hydroxy acid dehydrogenase YdfG
MGNLDGRTALVTGASSGIGAATARALGLEGAAVAVAARRADRLDALVAELETGGARAIAIELDVTDEASCRAAVATTVARFGGLDLLVNNAGLMLIGPVDGAQTEDWRRMLATNTLGLMYMTHAALPEMLDLEVADIVNVSSVAGRTTSPGAAVYNATKWAVNGFSESLRQEVTTRGVRVSLVEPGAVGTELTSHITDAGAKAAAEDWYASMRGLDAEDIARAVLYIAGQPPHVSVNEVLVRPTEQT